MGVQCAADRFSALRWTLASLFNTARGTAWPAYGTNSTGLGPVWGGCGGVTVVETVTSDEYLLIW